MLPPDTTWSLGLSRVPMNTGLPLADFDGVVTLDPQQPAVLYAGTRSGTVFRFAPAEDRPTP